MALFLKKKYKGYGDQANFSPSLEANLDEIKQSVGQSDDLVIRRFRLGKTTKLPAAVVYIDGMVDQSTVEHLLSESILFDEEFSNMQEALHLYFDSFGDTKVLYDRDALLTSLLSGHVISFVNGHVLAYSIDMIFWQTRQVDAPSSENVIRGPKEAFVEAFRVNTTLIRRRIKDPNLRFETYLIGTRSETTVVVTYIADIVNPKILKELHERIDQIHTDSIQTSGELEELIQDNAKTPFPNVFSSERPDTISSHVLEGKIAIIVDGNPFVLAVPATFIDFIHSVEDYTQRADVGSLLRILRLVCVFISLYVPALYVAITTYHQELIPFNLMVSLAAQNEGTPFPTVLEVLILEVLFEIIREASIRMPVQIGTALSIVGALVVGQAVVEAGIISSSVVIVVAVTAIASFVFPIYNISVPFRINRFIVLVFASLFGLYGIFLFSMLLLIHLSGLKSYGLPYLEGLTPFVRRDQRDTIIRMPKWMLNTRPRIVAKNNRTRQQTPAPKPEKNS
ncbi:spore germination protein [Geomicrobium sp. JCM 19039]|uniref:spore germination protein n=1 Tax=Geomicrobium sp. JCM 19039 TaxID=1460636 RepID=UPI00045F2E15|nr:spore germination protein [Geomicrobium sp. JCM 19039]GAK14043.1 spore germination protein GerKA [Geomicrobium sp. JCM 19039]